MCVRVVIWMIILGFVDSNKKTLFVPGLVITSGVNLYSRVAAGPIYKSETLKDFLDRK